MPFPPGFWVKPCSMAIWFVRSQMAQPPTAAAQKIIESASSVTANNTSSLIMSRVSLIPTVATAIVNIFLFFGAIFKERQIQVAWHPAVPAISAVSKAACQVRRGNHRPGRIRLCADAHTDCANRLALAVNSVGRMPARHEWFRGVRVIIQLYDHRIRGFHWEQLEARDA